jgi:hypothetical protein
LFFGSSGIWTQGLTLGRCSYHLSIVYFWTRVSLPGWSWPWTHDPLVSAFPMLGLQVSPPSFANLRALKLSLYCCISLKTQNPYIATFFLSKEDILMNWMLD